jgi:hypothetical protein
LIRTSYQASISEADLRYSPVWDDLRQEPEFIEHFGG